MSVGNSAQIDWWQGPAGVSVRLAGRRSSCACVRRQPAGFRVVDVWQSEDACNRFGEALGPILQEVDVDDKPVIYEAHTLVIAQRG